MKKLIAMLVAVAAVATVKASDSYLMWMIGEGAPAFNYASLYVDKGAGGVVAIDEFLTGVESGTQTTLAQVSSLIATDKPDTSYKYYVELLNEVGEATYKSGLFGYSEVASYIYQAPGVPPTGAFDMGQGGFTAVPEPTSGLMMLLGFALLGLKRKRV